MAAASSGLRHPASASCLGRHLRLAGRCPNNSSLFPPLAAVVVVAGHNQRNFISITGLQKRLRAFLKPFFHGWSHDGKQPVPRSIPFCENGTAERPQTLRCPKIINNLSAKIAQSNAEDIQNRPAAIRDRQPCSTAAGCFPPADRGRQGRAPSAGQGRRPARRLPADTPLPRRQDSPASCPENRRWRSRPR